MLHDSNEKASVVAVAAVAVVTAAAVAEIWSCRITFLPRHDKNYHILGV